MIARFFRLLIRIYSYLVSPFLGRNCRYYPTCSCYADKAIERHGIIRGGFLAVMRVLRCHPWSKHSLIDPVPKEFILKNYINKCTLGKNSKYHAQDIT